MFENTMKYTQQDIDALSKKLDASKMIHEQIARLNSELDLDEAIEKVLDDVGRYMNAERAYIFEKRGGFYDNTYEWCAPGITSEIDSLQNIPKEGIENWDSSFIYGKCVIISDIEDIKETDPYTYAQLKRQNITNVVEAPIKHENDLMGFIGVDNAHTSAAKFISESLSLLGSFIGVAMRNREEREKLRKSNEEILNKNDIQSEILSSVSSGIFSYTLPERNILILNDEAKKIFGQVGINEDNIKTKIMANIIPADLQGVREAVKKLKNPGDRTEYIYHSVTADGGNATFNIETKLLSFSNGQRYVLSSINDITDQERMEKNLNEERKQYRNALMLGSEAIFSIKLDGGMLNEHIISESGENITKSIGLNIPADYEQLVEKWFSDERIVTDNKNVRIIRDKKKLIEYFEKGKSILEFEYYIPENGKYYRVLALFYKISGELYVSFIIYDVTSSRHEKRLRKNVIESLGRVYAGLYHFSLTENTYTSYKQNYDISNEISESGRVSDFIDIYINNYVTPEFRGKVSEFLNPESIRRSLDNSDYTAIEFVRKNLGWYRIVLVVSERSEGGRVNAVVFAGNVIEEQKRAELAQQEALKAAYESANIANSAKTDFLANMSHDIRTPMNAIIGLTAIAGTHIDDKERLTDCLSKITVSSKHLLGIINEILDMSKIESGKMELQESQFNLPELIDNLLSMSKSDISAMDHTLSVSIENIDHENVIGDSQRIQQVFMNLMSNSIKYTPAGGSIRLYISEKSTNKPKVGCYEFIFEDNGIGMSKEFMEHMFEPFTRDMNDSRTGKIQGTGLGMPIAKNIVQMMNGDIKVESKLNEGTKITVTLFLKIKNNKEKIDYEKFIDLPVLVADDDKISCEYTCKLLNEIGMSGEWVLTGSEAVRKTIEHHEKNEDFFAVILDWKMPGMDGIETTREIRKAIGKDVPIIIISAYDWSDIELEARAAGANSFISKPLFKSRMVHLFDELLNSGDSEREILDLSNFAEENFKGKRALLVEDNELNAEIAEEIFKMAGLEIELAKNGKEAVDIMADAEDNYFDIIFMDIQMPIMNGYEASRAIRTLPGDYVKSVPIIAMTANAFAEDVAAAKNAGMNEHIAKPLDFTQLQKSLNHWLRER
ncbi:MAG: response regulator [Clostridium sp.]|nr:response regulator [Clostridium sp.]MCM1546868.1 response regulator [Ruminococcus sp.]